MQDGIEQQHTPSLTTIRSDANEEGIRSLRPLPDDSFSIINEVIISGVGSMPIIKGDLRQLPIKVQRFVIEKASLMRPRGIYICDGSVREADEIVAKLVERRTLSVLTAYENNYICRTDPQDVTESIAWIATPGKFQTVCRTNDDVVPIMCNWISPAECGKELDSRFPGCMTGRVMYVIPFSLGVICGPFSKIGIELTDSNYTVLCMRIMTRVSPKVFEALGDGDFVRCIHSVGLPRPARRHVTRNWPCNTDLAFLVHRPAEREIWSFGSGFGSNSLLGRKSMALRVASAIARDEGWLAEHMAVFSVTDPRRREHFMTAAFPAACGKTSLAMLRPTLAGWKVRCIGDDIAWLRFGDDGRLYAINPEAGFFGIAPGLSKRTNPVAMAMLRKNCIFTNVAETANGEFFWQGLENEIRDKTVEMLNWEGRKWHIGDEGRAAHHNARYAAPASQCQLMHYKWDSPKGVPIDAILFGARRPRGVPLVYETFSWQHGVFTAACLKSEVCFEGGTKKEIFHDPMAMRNYLSYNFGEYLQHWLGLEKSGRKLPKIFHVNWFRQGDDGELLWPGHGENIRVLEWIVRRIEGDQQCGRETAIGIVPFEGHLQLDGLDQVRFDDLMSVPPEYWREDADEVRCFLEEQLGQDMPVGIREQMERQEKRIGTL
uniref:Phosphoenolpyruvate carboxykinase [GTP] n=1 Tax=Ascaris suum TaxID=6253 RepID=F1KYY2_ASCSU